MKQKVFSPHTFEILLIFLIIFTPLFYGALLPLPLAITQFAIFSLFALWIVRLLVIEESRTVIYPSSVVLIFIFLAIAIFQLIPLPSGILKTISSQTLQLYKQYMPSYNQSQFYPLAIYSFVAKAEIVKFISFFMVFLLAVNTIKKQRQFERIFLVIIVWAVFLAFYGMVRKYSVLEKEITGSFSTFGNRNHYAGYMTMVVPLTVGYALYCYDKLKKLLFGFLAALLAASVFLSLSRGGSVSLVFSLLLMVAFLKKAWVKEKTLWIIGGVLLLTILFLLMPGLEGIKYRFSLFSGGLYTRMWKSKDALAMVKDFPLLGIGWGNFQYVFPFYRSVVTYAYYYYLHNDHLQLVVELGLIASSCYFIFLFLIFKDLARKVRERRDPFVKNMVTGGMCGLLGVIVHSFFDFNFHIPAVSFLFWALLGLVYKCVYTHFRLNEKEDT